MKKLLKKLENMMVAITFAEAGEYDKANMELGVDLKHEQEEEAAQLLQWAKSKSACENPGKQL
jgi:molybdopterin-biosynthesis enzyme MoeA-like protein